MESKGLVMPTTIFRPVKPTREFAPLSEEPGHICRWQGGGPISIASLSVQTHMLGQNACSSRVSTPEARSTLKP
jgi:hypothetical protein